MACSIPATPFGANGVRLDTRAEGRPITTTANRERIDNTTMTSVTLTERRIPPAFSIVIASAATTAAVRAGTIPTTALR